MNFFVYQLVGPDGAPFYVGASSNEGRLRLHMSRAKRGMRAVERRIRELGFAVRLEKLIDGVARETALWWERHLIATMEVVNEPNAGVGPNAGWRHSAEAKAKIAAANVGRTKDAATRDKIAARARERRHSSDRRAKFSETIQCPHCRTVGGRAGMQRWHFDRCSSKEMAN